MTSRTSSRISILTAAVLLAAYIPAHAATTEPMDLDPDMQAKVAREKAKARYERGNKSGDTKMKRGNDSECGNISIGNSDDEQKGSRKIAPREKNVIITGPVINAGNCK